MNDVTIHEKAKGKNIVEGMLHIQSKQISIPFALNIETGHIESVRPKSVTKKEMEHYANKIGKKYSINKETNKVQYLYLKQNKHLFSKGKNK